MSIIDYFVKRRKQAMAFAEELRRDSERKERARLELIERQNCYRTKNCFND